VVIRDTFTVVGNKEGEGPLKDNFDLIVDDLWGEETWEKCESKLQLEAVKLALTNAKLLESNIDYLFSGDLLNQIISSSFAARKLGMPF